MSKPKTRRRPVTECPPPAVPDPSRVPPARPPRVRGLSGHEVQRLGEYYWGRCPGCEKSVPAWKATGVLAASFERFHAVWCPKRVGGLMPVLPAVGSAGEVVSCEPAPSDPLPLSGSLPSGPPCDCSPGVVGAEGEWVHTRRCERWTAFARTVSPAAKRVSLAGAAMLEQAAADVLKAQRDPGGVEAGRQRARERFDEVVLRGLSEADREALGVTGRSAGGAARVYAAAMGWARDDAADVRWREALAPSAETALGRAAAPAAAPAGEGGNQVAGASIQGGAAGGGNVRVPRQCGGCGVVLSRDVLGRPLVCECVEGDWGPPGLVISIPVGVEVAARELAGAPPGDDVDVVARLRKLRRAIEEVGGEDRLGLGIPARGDGSVTMEDIRRVYRTIVGFNAPFPGPVLGRPAAIDWSRERSWLPEAVHTATVALGRYLRDGAHDEDRLKRLRSDVVVALGRISTSSLERLGSPRRPEEFDDYARSYLDWLNGDAAGVADAARLDAMFCHTPQPPAPTGRTLLERANEEGLDADRGALARLAFAIHHRGDMRFLLRIARTLVATGAAREDKP